ncbi:hypothetical protein [Leptospira licerasiae]|uniref:Lipoprotein n=1 Tax=Leptospira licerasiae str. MMD4847 TaxID=1049971 RepID=A0ABN0HDS9_9LEPT|nr:hypothetical protein [Leptospira licerasiae]EIE00998.1 hypothetical protein LEP1GSC185_3861 [Leptospira licerasiae serovar Varillal str. VAR 010]EJZ43770.1 hypothetical protein LEP1GSC178_2030 [Leptospira licerasiae str. MMD4847]
MRSCKFCNLILLVAISLMYNCNTINAYTKNRAIDFSDVLGISIDKSAGASVAIGPLTVGAIASQSIILFKNGKSCIQSDSFAAIIALGETGSLPPCTYVELTLGPGIVTDILLHGEALTDNFYSQRGKVYRPNREFPLHLYGRLKVSVGFILGATVEVNWIEFIDLLLGIVGFDLLKDDIWVVDEKGQLRIKVDTKSNNNGG